MPDLLDEFYTDAESGDSQLVHRGGHDLQERSLLTGEVTPLFELEESEWIITGFVAMDERDIFQVSTAGIRRFDRATRELSLFAPHPEPEEDPALPADAWYGPIAISEAYVVAIMTDRHARDLTTKLYPDYVVALIERATGTRRFIPVERPIGAARLYSQGNRFFQVSPVDTNPDPYRSFYAGEIYAYDFDGATAEPFLQSSVAFDRFGIEFWKDSLLTTILDEGGVHFNLVRVPLAGGEPEIVAADLEQQAFAVSGNEAFVLLADGTHVHRLAAIDLAHGETRDIGACDAVPFHGSDDHIYAYTGGLSVLRLTP